MRALVIHACRHVGVRGGAYGSNSPPTVHGVRLGLLFFVSSLVYVDCEWKVLQHFAEDLRYFSLAEMCSCAFAPGAFCSLLSLLIYFVRHLGQSAEGSQVADVINICFKALTKLFFFCRVAGVWYICSEEQKPVSFLDVHFYRACLISKAKWFSFQLNQNIACSIQQSKILLNPPAFSKMSYEILSFSKSGIHSMLWFYHLSYICHKVSS